MASQPINTTGYPMSIEITTNRLKLLLNDQENKVIALSGKWGTGKSYLWENLRSNSSSAEIKASLKISLFGISEISQIKMRVLQSAIPADTEGVKANIFKKTIDTLKTAKSALAGIHSSFSALDELAILAMPNLLKKRIIILDDIERKHENLSIDEILGFIDEYARDHGTRFILILNSDKLDNKNLWEALREKVIDQEIRLNTTPCEAYDIASISCKSTYARQIKEAVKICKVTNIRIIKKIIKNINFLLDDHDQLTEAVLAKLIPSTVLLSATYYKGIEEGPTFEQITTYGKNINWESYYEDKNSSTPSTPEPWTVLIDELGISCTDRYEDLVVSYLESGLLDNSKISKELGKYVRDNNTMLAKHNAHQLIHDILWDQQSSEQTLLNTASKLIHQVKYMDAVLVSALSANVKEINNGSSTANLLISTWISNIDKNELVNYDSDDNLGRPIHEDIQKTIAAAQIANAAKQSAFEACIKIALTKNRSSSGTKILNNTTPAQYENILTHLSSADLKDFTRQMTKMHINNNAEFKDLSKATNNFILACSNIIKNQKPARLSKILHRLFDLHDIAI